MTGTDRHQRPPRALVTLRAWQDRHPALWSSRHVVLNLLGVAATLLGVSLLVRLVVERLLPDLDVSIPKPELTDWLRHLDPLHHLQPVLEWIAGLIPDIDLPHGPPWIKIALALLVAVGVSVREYRKRTHDRERHGEDG